MLVMYTLNQSVSSKLPPTSYIKLIDIWLLFGLGQPFIMIIILVLIEHLPNDSVKPFNEGKVKTRAMMLQRWVKKFGQVINPVWQLIFVISFALISFFLFMEE